MFKNTYPIELDVKQQSPETTGIVFISADSGVNELEIKIKDGSDYIDYTQVNHAAIAFIKPDKTYVVGTLVSADPVTDGYTYELGTNEIAAVGDLACSVSLYGAAGERLTVSRFTARVSENPIPDDAVESSTEISALSDAFVLLDELEAALAALPVGATLPSYTGNANKFLKVNTGATGTLWSAVAKADVGLGSVDNTSDTSKPVSTAQQTALNLKADLTLMLTAAKTIYVATTGNDTTGTGLVGAPYATLSKAFSMIPSNMNGYNATINLAAGTYTADVSVSQKFGGAITLVGAGSSTTTISGLVSFTSVMEITLQAVKISKSSGFAILATSGSTVLMFGTDVVIDGINKTAHGILVRNGSKIVVDGNTVTCNNTNFALYAYNADVRGTMLLAGTNNNTGVGSTASIVIIRTPTITATTAEYKSDGGQIFK